MKLIYDEEQLEKFFNILKPLKTDEVYFISMSARKKYLTLDERKTYNLNRAEMFAHKLSRANEFRFFLRSCKTLEVSEGGYTDQSGQHILPQKCLVMYININPSSGKKALKEFYGKTQEMIFSNSPDEHKNFAKLDKLLYTCYQRNRGSKYFIDIDMDIKHLPDDIQKQILEKMITTLNDYEIKYHGIETKSGHHILLDRHTVKTNLKNITDSVQDLIPEGKEGEVIINKNGMVPIPGTLQGGFPVNLWEDS